MLFFQTNIWLPSVTTCYDVRIKHAKVGHDLPIMRAFHAMTVKGRTVRMQSRWITSRTSSIQFAYFPEHMNHEIKRLQRVNKMSPLLREPSQKPQVPRLKRCIARILHCPKSKVTDSETVPG